MAHTILSQTTASVSELKRNPMGTVAAGEGFAVAILNGSVAIRNGWCKNVYMYRITYANKELNC